MNAALTIRVSPHTTVCLSDQRREARIRALGQLLNREYAAGNREEARRLWQEFNAAILARSPEQVAKMECAMQHDGRNEYSHKPRHRNVRAGGRSAAW